VIEPVTAGAFSAVAHVRTVVGTEAPALDAELRGTADARAVDAMTSFLAALHAEARQVGAREVLIDLRKLEFMSSSCFKSMISWLANLESEPNPYLVCLRPDPTKHWQARSLEAIKALAGGLVRIEALP
jgi:anti-anti-sigma regulatory factor